MNSGLVPLAVVAALALSGCGKKVEMTNATPEQVAEATKDAKFLDPGQWSNTSEIVDVKIEGMPAEAKAMGDSIARAMKGRKTAYQSCLTEEEAKRPAANMFAGKDQGNCIYQRFAMSGGKIDASMTCTPPSGQPGKMTLTMAGTYSGTEFAVDANMKMSGAAGMPGGGMTVTARNTGKRTGDCAGKEGGKAS